MVLRRLLITTVFVLGVFATAFAQVEQSAPTAIVGGKRWAIVIGASSYEHYSKLNYAVDDAKSFANKLKSTFGFTDDTLKLLTDDAGPRMTPTAGHILGELAATLADKRLDKSDLFVFYFSGHGSGIETGDYLLPADARPETVAQLGVPVRQVIEQFVKAGLKNVLIICDACRSGAKNPFGRELNQLAERANIAVIQGCEPGQQSREEPKFGRGLFTHFLLKALDDPTARHPESGALWAKPLAEKLSAETFNYGKRAFGQYAQRPTAWTNAKRDVLLGVFPTSASGDASLKAFLTEAKALNRDNYVSALNEYAVRLFELEKYSSAIEGFKVLDQISSLAPDSRYAYTVALSLEDRFEEMEQVLSGFDPSAENTFYRDLAITSAFSSKFSVEEKLKCAERAWNIEKSWTVGFLRWGMLKYFGEPDKRGPFLEELRSASELPPRGKAYIEAEILANQGKPIEAIAKFNSAIKLEGALPNVDLLRHSIHLLLIEQGMDKQIMELLSEWSKDKKSGHVWSMLLAMHYMRVGEKDKMMAAIKLAIAGPIDADYLLFAVKTAKSRTVEIEADIVRIAKTMPLAWKAQLAAALASGLAKEGLGGAVRGFTSNTELFEKNAEYNFEGFKFLSELIDEKVATGELEPVRVQQFLQIASSQLTMFADRLEQDAEFWQMYIRVMLQAERSALLERIIDRKFDPIKRMETIRPDLRSMLAMAYFNAGATAKADAIMKAGGIQERERADTELMYACYLASIKRYADARKAAPKRAEVVKTFQSLWDGLNALLLVIEGKKEEGRAIALKYERTLDLQTQPLIALTFVALEDWEKAELGCNVSRLARAWGFGFLHIAALKELYDHVRKTGNHEFADGLAYECSTVQPGNRLYDSVRFGEKAEIAAYAGAYEFNVVGNSDWNQTFEGKITLSALASGKVTGIFEPKSGEAVALSGTIDANGIWNGKAKIGNEECVIWARLAPADLIAKFEPFKNPGLLVQLTRANQTRAVWLLRPIAAQQNSGPKVPVLDLIERITHSIKV